MRYLWDTDTCIYHLNGNANVRQKVKRVGAKAIYSTMVSIAELKFGAFNSTRVEENLHRIEELQQNVTILTDFNEAIATHFAENKSMLKKRGIKIGDFDLLTEAQAVKLIADYQLARAKSPLLLTWVYNWMHDTLEKGWRDYKTSIRTKAE